MAKTAEDALALFASGKSPRECEKLTGIPATTISRKAKERGIVKGSVAHLITDSIRVYSEIGAQSTEVREVIGAEISRQLDGMEFYATNARKAVKMGLAAFSQAPSPMGMKTVLEGMKTGMIVEGLVPFHPSSAVITNTNANQVNIEPIRFTRAKD